MLEALRKAQADGTAFAVAIGLNKRGKQQAAWLMLFHISGPDSEQCACDNIVRVVPQQVDARLGDQGRTPVPENRLTRVAVGLHPGNREGGSGMTAGEAAAFVGVRSFFPDNQLQTFGKKGAGRKSVGITQHLTSAATAIRQERQKCPQNQESDIAAMRGEFCLPVPWTVRKGGRGERGERDRRNN